MQGLPAVDLDYSHDYEVLIPSLHDTFRITEIKYLVKYMKWPGGGTVDEICSDMMSYTVNGKHKEDHWVTISK